MKGGVSVKEILEEVIDFLRKEKVDYADVRYERHLEEEIVNENGFLKTYTFSEDQGVGIRVLKNGGWGFSSTDRLSKDNILRSARFALDIAETSSKRKGEGRVAEEPPHVDSYKTRYEKDPFEISKKEKVELLKEAVMKMKEVEGIVKASGSLRFRKIQKLFLNTDGSVIEQEIVISGGGIEAFSAGKEGFQKRSYPSSFGGDFATRGWEFIESMDLMGKAEETAQEAVSLLSAPEIEPGEYDIIIGGSQLALQIHESCGHPSELDRVFGSEISFAGGSFLTPDKLGRLKYGSEIVNIVADATVEGGLGSFGYDDEGVKAQKSFIVKEGIFVGYLMDRESAAKLGLRSNGAGRASSWNRIPIVRMTNINLLPGNMTLDELISGIDYGFLLETNKSWSIDDMRVNFQFATEIAYEIKGGRLTGKIFRNPVYYGTTVDFWNSCDGIANEKYWRVWGIPNCGKGQPIQVMHVGHGASPARFRKVKVGVAK